MKRNPLLPVIVLGLMLLAQPSFANSSKDGYAAYARGDYVTALRIWESLAEQGNQSAEYGLGELYFLGRGVPRDDRKAARWYELAAATGHILAQSR